VWHEGVHYADLQIPLFGLHNVRNALAAVAVAHASGVPARTIAEGLLMFRGVKRRLDAVGEVRGITVYDDFAHHPTAIAETLAGLRAANPHRRIWAVFEPRSASSSRKVFQRDFAKAFGPADEVVIAPVFRTSLPESERLSQDELIADLQSAGQRARLASSIDDIVATVAREGRQGDLVVFMSNGGFGGIHQKTLAALGGMG
jgi:UDP-N-acetylmuramate: L-alanyl-gamma-D-glutamyl-meso-diaminopimelate ligase